MDKHLAAFQHRVASKYQEYNGLFLQLPFSGVPEAGRELPLFAAHCKNGLANQLTPTQIIETYFANKSTQEKFTLLFLFLQFVERQIVLFDALEDCAFALINDCDNHPKEHNSGFQTRVVLTAHPTQFYSQAVLNIIEDLTSAIKSERNDLIEKLLLQMGKTSFMSHKQPTPIDEAAFLITYLERVFYPTLKKIQGQDTQQKILLGFWPGADRDGNPNVTAKTTLTVAKLLKHHIIQCYRQDLHGIQRRMTFRNTQAPLQKILNQLDKYSNSSIFLNDLLQFRQIIMNEHDGLFIEVLDPLISAVRCFGFYFASLDIRQDSGMHQATIAKYLEGYASLSHQEKISALHQALSESTPTIDTHDDVIAALKTIPVIQQNNGEAGCHRYIISNTHGAHNVLEILLLAKWAGIDQFNVDIVPLFESIDDLVRAEDIMTELYQNPIYQTHLAQRAQQQTIMLGFSDGTKDGGYITANWSIYQAKKRLSANALRYNVEVIFFDGRGGPPARGGGNTQRYYRAQEADIAMSQIQLTIQGQTISTNFGTTTAAQYNLEQLYSAGLKTDRPTMSKDQVSLLQELSELSAQKYQALKKHPQFLSYLEHATPLNFYGKLNIASRPPRRGNSKQLSLNDLRAIPFVGAWSQMKQNVPGYYGVGTALYAIGQPNRLRDLYKNCLFFSTLIDNAAQSLKKTYFALTQYLAHDVQYRDLWNDLSTEAALTEQMILTITTESTLLEHNPVTQLSIELRNEIVLPLLVIQQYALMGLRNPDYDDKDILNKLLLRSMATNINAARNAA